MKIGRDSDEDKKHPPVVLFPCSSLPITAPEAEVPGTGGP